MTIDIRKPDIIEKHGSQNIPKWKCPNCGEHKTLEEFGTRYRGDAYKDQDVWHKQSWCLICRKESFNKKGSVS